jgi:hypothetical protein
LGIESILDSLPSPAAYGEVAVALLRAAAPVAPMLRIEGGPDGCRLLLDDGRAVPFPGRVSGEHLFAALDAVSDHLAFRAPEGWTNTVTHRLADLGKAATLRFGPEEGGARLLEIEFADRALSDRERLDWLETMLRRHKFVPALDYDPEARHRVGRTFREAVDAAMRGHLKVKAIAGADEGTSEPPAVLAAVYEPIMATAYVAVCPNGGLWAAARTPEECLDEARKELAEFGHAVEGADKLTGFALADFSRPIAEQPPAEGTVTVFLCTERVFRHMADGEDGAVRWRACGNILDFADDPDCDECETNPWTDKADEEPCECRRQGA